MVMSEFVSNPIFYTEKTKDISISKSNTLIEAGFDLTLAEHDLMTLAINKLHKQATGNH
ncbi:RepB family plasmid replication initiator protein, partial [Acinetobacter guillouiae]